MGSPKLIEVAKRGRVALAKWRRANPDVLLILTDADLQDADLRGANLKRADLTGADLRGANLIGAQLSEADLTRADLRGARLTKADFYSARLFKATLSGAEAGGSYFRRADFTEADCSGTDLTKADLRETNFKNGTLAGASLVGADLSYARLAGVDMRDAVLGWSTLGHVDLSQIVGLDQLKHAGPSSIGLDTARLSHEKMSEKFLHGCGISEGVIQHWKSLFGHPAEEFSCFIRFAPDDESFAKHLYDRAQEKGLRCWLDEMPHSARDRRARSSPTSYETTERVLLCASKASLSSWWVNDEIDRLAVREQRYKDDTGRPVRYFFPLNLDGYMFSGDWKHKQDKQIAKQAIDFVGWRRNKDKFDQELTKLLQFMVSEKR
ncbi:MAG: toll/interleukin-1 receptor domain-containing protein [Planctomycetota bacterium]|nr:toll/interleukin-1 receptor domain-containing protein [Planctomycetota bacterium]MDA1163335.1 toll/interleukin-1 receptor domain-containing protein [Planctomycetota bacterium]